MKTIAILMLGVSAFFGTIGIIYWFLAYEDAGFMMLMGTVLFGALPGSYYLWWCRHMKVGPEDNPEATIEEGAGVIGTFSSSSIWPFVLGMAAFLVALSAVFGFWLLAPALVLVVMAASGYTAETRRGGQH